MLTQRGLIHVANLGLQTVVRAGEVGVVIRRGWQLIQLKTTVVSGFGSCWRGLREMVAEMRRRGWHWTRQRRLRT